MARFAQHWVPAAPDVKCRQQSDQYPATHNQAYDHRPHGRTADRSGRAVNGHAAVNDSKDEERQDGRTHEDLPEVLR